MSSSWNPFSSRRRSRNRSRRRRDRRHHDRHMIFPDDGLDFITDRMRDDLLDFRDDYDRPAPRRYIHYPHHRPYRSRSREFRQRDFFTRPYEDGFRTREWRDWDRAASPPRRMIRRRIRSRYDDDDSNDDDDDLHNPRWQTYEYEWHDDGQNPPQRRERWNNDRGNRHDSGWQDWGPRDDNDLRHRRLRYFQNDNNNDNDNNREGVAPAPPAPTSVSTSAPQPQQPIPPAPAQNAYMAGARNINENLPDQERNRAGLNQINQGIWRAENNQPPQDDNNNYIQQQQPPAAAAAAPNPNPNPNNNNPIIINSSSDSYDSSSSSYDSDIEEIARPDFMVAYNNNRAFFPPLRRYHDYYDRGFDDDDDDFRRGMFDPWFFDEPWR